MENIKKKLRDLRKGRQEELLAYEKSIDDERTKGEPDWDKIKELKTDMGSFLYQCYDVEIDYLETQQYCSLLGKCELPLPNIEDETYWEKDAWNRMVLTTLGKHECRLTIRAEKKAKIETIALFVTMMTGIIGAIIGLLSVILLLTQRTPL